MDTHDRQTKQNKSNVHYVIFVGLAAILFLQHVSVGRTTHQSYAARDWRDFRMPGRRLFGSGLSDFQWDSVEDDQNISFPTTATDAPPENIKVLWKKRIEHTLRLRKAAADHLCAGGCLPSQDKLEKILPVLETWTYKPSFRDAETTACRVHWPIRTCGEKVLLAAALKRYDHTLAECGLPPIEYAPNDGQMTSQIVHQYPRDEGVVPSHMLDVVGLWKLRDHMPHFLTDFFPNLMLFDLVLGSADRTGVTYKCYLSDGKGCSPLQVQKLRQKTELHPAVILDHRLETKNDNHWVKSLLSLLPLNPRGPSMLYRPYLFNPASVRGEMKQSNLSDEKLADLCSLSVPFRSVLSMERPQTNQFKRHIDDHTLYIENSIERRCQIDWPATPKILVLNRHVNDSRHLLDVAELTRSLKRSAPHVDVEEVSFEGMPFHLQIEKMNSADLVIAVHGAGLTNLMFLKSGSHVIEISPFGWRAGIFGHISAFFDVRFSSIPARPQVEQVAKCLHASGSDHPEQKLARDGFLQAFGDVARQYPTLNVTDLVEIEKFAHRSNINRLRVCLRGQSLKPEISELVSVTMKALKGRPCE